MTATNTRAPRLGVSGRRMDAVPPAAFVPEPIRPLAEEFGKLRDRLNEVNTKLARHNRERAQLEHAARNADVAFAAQSGRSGSAPKSLTPNMDKLIREREELTAEEVRLRSGMLAVGDEIFAWFAEHGTEARETSTATVEDAAHAYRAAIEEVERVSQRYHEALDVRAWIDRMLSPQSRVSWVGGATPGPVQELYADAERHDPDARRHRSPLRGFGA